MYGNTGIHNNLINSNAAVYIYYILVDAIITFSVSVTSISTIVTVE